MCGDLYSLWGLRPDNLSQMTKHPFIVEECVLLVLRPDIFLPENRPIFINTDRALRGPWEDATRSKESSWVLPRSTNDVPYLVDASGRSFTRFDFKSLRNPGDRPSVFSLLVNANSKLQSAEGPSNPYDLVCYIGLVRGVVEQIFYVPEEDQGQSSSLTSPVSSSFSLRQDPSGSTTSAPTQSRISGDDRQGRDPMDRDSQGGGPVEGHSNVDTGFEEPSCDLEEDDEDEDEDEDTINGLTFPEMRTVMQRVSDGTISGEERAEAAMLMLGMAGGSLSYAILSPSF